MYKRQLNETIEKQVEIDKAQLEAELEAVELLSSLTDPGGRYAAGRYGVFNFQQVDNARDPSQWGDTR